MKRVHGLVPEMKGVQFVCAMRQTAQWACGKWQDLLEASEWYLEAQGRHLNQGDRDALEDPVESEEGERVGSCLRTKIPCLIGAEVNIRSI